MFARQLIIFLDSPTKAPVIIKKQATDCLEDCADDRPEVVKLRIDNIIYSPVGTSSLIDEQKARVEIIAEIFTNVFPQTCEEWNRGFSRDQNPEREIIIWECIAKAFLKIDQVKFLSEEQKKEAFDLLLTRSMKSAGKVLKEFKLKVFSRRAAEEILRGYEAPPIPIVVERRAN